MSTEHLLGDIGMILTALIGVENQPRQEAEAHLFKLTAQTPAEVLLLLAQVGAQGVGGFQLDQRLLALILLRRVAFKEHPGIALNPQDPRPTAPFDAVPEATRARIERVLGAGLEDEMDVCLRKGLGVCVGEWVKASVRRQRPFQSLPSVLLKLAASPHPFHRFSPFQLLDANPSLLAEASPGRESVPANKVTELLLGGLHDPSVDVRIEALKATRSVLHDGMTFPERAVYGPALVSATFDVIPALPLSALETALELMVDIASSFPDIFQSSLLLWISFLLMCVAPPRVFEHHAFSRYPHREMEWNAWLSMSNMAWEVLFSLVIADPLVASKWEDGFLVQDMVSSLIGRQVASFAADGGSCEEWLAQEDLEEEDESYPGYSEEMLDRLANIMKGSAVIKAVAQQAQQLLPQDDWKAKYCSLVAIGSIADGCSGEMKSEARSILELIAPSASDGHPRVRYGFLFCIGQLCTGLEGVIQNEYADATLDIAMRLLQDDVARVREAAAATLVHFFDTLNVPTYEDKLEPILTGLITALQKGPLYVQEQVLAAIAVIASNSGRHFLPYYQKTIDFNLSILAAPPDAAHQKLVGMSMRCATLIGQAVGKEHFFKDAVPLCQALLVIQNQIHAPEDRRRGYLADAWLVIAGVITHDFAPFLPFVVPPVLHAASYLPAPLENGDDDEYEYDLSNSAEMQEKEEAFTQLAVYVHEMRAHYSPWLSQTMTVTLAAIHMEHVSEGVLGAACYLVPGLLQVAKDAKIWVVDETNLEGVFRTLINAIPHQYDAVGVGQLYQSIGDALRVLETPLPEANTGHLARATMEWLAGLYERRQERAAEAAQESERGDYWLWADAERYEEAAEAEALGCMDTAFGRVVRLNQHALGSMTEIVMLSQKVRAAAYDWGDADGADGLDVGGPAGAGAE